MKFRNILFLCSLLLLVGFVPPIQIQKKPPSTDRPKLSVFDIPRFEAQRAIFYRQIYQLLEQKNYNRAEQILRKWSSSFPRDYAAPYDLACIHALQGQTNEAFKLLKKSVEEGFRNTEHIEKDDDLASLREDPRFQQILDISRKPLEPKPIIEIPDAVPAKPAERQVLVAKNNFGYDGRTKMFLGILEKSNSANKAPITTRKDRTGDLLRKWQKAGTAAGNAGDFYDNHDQDHSNMNFKQYPQLTRIEFGEELRKRNLHHGLQNQLIFNAVVLGNSSTALTQGPFWRSQPRQGLTTPGGAARMAVHYRSNHLYFYPEHRDHDPGRNGKDGGYGDVFPANTPYIVISQGSSGSDRVFMDAFAATLAALRPKTKARLTKNGLLVPTLQMVFRQSNRNVKSDKDYFTGKAHPTVFDGKQIDVEKMVRRAHEIQAKTLPPLAQIAVAEEMEEKPGIDYFDIGPRQKLFTTPHAIARIHKTTARNYHITLDAKPSADLDDLELTYRWAVLRGDANGIKIETEGPKNPVAKITIPWHDRRPIHPGSNIHSNRIDIGLFVSNGTHWSAPAIFSVFHPDNQERSYDGDGRILSVKYDPSIYNDPRIDAPVDWTDTYHYDNGKLLGWTRARKNQELQDFTAEGRLILEKDASGKPTQTTAVRYVPKRLSNGKFKLEQQIIEESK